MFDEKRSVKNIFWQPWADTGLEHLRLVYGNDFLSANGCIVRENNGKTFRASYKILCSRDWHFRRMELTVETDRVRTLLLELDARGWWFDESGREYPDLRRCREVDFSATPFTNSMALGRLKLETGESVAFETAFVHLPELTIHPVGQYYACGQKGEAYRYRKLGSDSEALLPVDADLLVLDHPGLFRRVG